MKKMMQSGSRVVNAGKYPVYIGGNVSAILDDLLSHSYYKKSRIFILADENTSGLWKEHISPATEILRTSKHIEIPAGEKNKNIKTCEFVWSKLIHEGADRHSILVNIGGGMVTDLGGFIAATYKRGIRYINIPTTLTGMIDAAIGGKVGVDHDNLKNQIGRFLDPEAVVIHTGFLRSLPKQEFLSGYAEMAKHGLIGDAGYWNRIREMGPEGPEDWFELISRSVEIKVAAVRDDPYERKSRKALNFGHTVGHALESYHLKNTNLPLSHGVAVAAGIVCEAFISNKQAGLSSGSLSEITGFIREMFPPVIFPGEHIMEIVEDMRNDKKNEEGNMLFTLIPVIGRAVVNQVARQETVTRSLEYYKQEVAG